MRVSHETSYRSLFIQACGVLKKELIRHQRSRRMMAASLALKPVGVGFRVSLRIVERRGPCRRNNIW